MREKKDVIEILRFCKTAYENELYRKRNGLSNVSEITHFYGKVKSVLSVLSYEETVVINEFYIHGRSWVYISGILHYSESHCRNFRNSALDILISAFENQGIFSDFHKIKR